MGRPKGSKNKVKSTEEVIKASPRRGKLPMKTKGRPKSRKWAKTSKACSAMETVTVNHSDLSGSRLDAIITYGQQLLLQRNSLDVLQTALSKVDGMLSSHTKAINSLVETFNKNAVDTEKRLHALESGKQSSEWQEEEVQLSEDLINGTSTSVHE